MFKIIVTDKISDQGMAVFRNAGFQVDEKLKLPTEELAKLLPEYDGWVVRSGTKCTPELIAAATRLKIIGRAGAGLDNVDLSAATKRGVIVMNTPDGNTISTAEHTLAMLMAMARQIPQAYVSLREKKWERTKFVGTELFNKTLGVIGLGRIGTNVALKARGLGMRIVGFDPFIDPSKSNAHDIEVVPFEELIKRSDFITVHTPLTKETKGMIGAKEFAFMKNGVRIVNCARGGIYDEKALYEALKSGKVAAASLDVFEQEPPFENPLLTLDNVVYVPHLGASTKEAQENVAVVVAEQMVEAMKGGRVRNAANMPSLDPKALEELTPYIRLIEAMGAFHAQMAESFIQRIQVSYEGSVSAMDTKTLTLSLVKGILQRVMTDAVNYVNALVLAKERGFEIVETKNEKAANYSSLIRVTVDNEKGSHSVSGTVFDGKEIRIVGLDGYEADFEPQGSMIYMSHDDKPGIVGRLGTVLGSNGVNIAGLYVGRQARGGKAVAMVNVDGEVGDKALQELKGTSSIHDVRFVRFD